MFISANNSRESQYQGEKKQTKQVINKEKIRWLLHGESETDDIYLYKMQYVEL